jgi:hypothetical protein
MTREESLEPAGETSDVDANPAARVAHPRLAHIVLSTAFIEDHEPAQVQAYIDALVAAQEHAHSTSEHDLADGLRDRLDAAGVILPDESYRNLARQVHDSAGLAVSSDSGEVLYGDPHLAQPHSRTRRARHRRRPEDPDRPVYS